MATKDNSSILSLFQLTNDQLAATTARDTAISVTAGAGSGKTRALVGRYLSLLESKFPLRSLVAITFTDKAAREMRNRVRGLTAQWLAQAEATPDRQLWQEVFSALDSARISTIHGLCAVILRTHPVEAGLDPGFVVLDEGQSALWQAHAVEEGLAWVTTQPEVAQLFSFFQEGQLRDLLAELLARRLDAESTLAAKPDDQLLAEWSAVLNHWLAIRLAWPAWSESLRTLAALQSQNEDDKLEVARRAVLACWDRAAQAQANRDWPVVFEALVALRGAVSTGGQKGNWAAADLEAAREAMRALRDHFDQVIGRLVDPKKPPSWALDMQAAALLPLVRRLFEYTCAVYRGYKNNAQALDFDDLEQMTVRLLVGHESVRARWQQEIQAVLLVDEFQDTNQRQREIVYALAGFEPAETAVPAQNGEGAKKRNRQVLSPNSPISQSSLFVVGDAKQSIYRFRGADVAVFRQVQTDIQAAGGALINFDLTFRAHSALVGLTNVLLSPLMLAEDDPVRPFEVPFAPLVAFRQEPRQGIKSPYLEFQLGLGADKNEGRRAAAVGLADHLHKLHAAGQIYWQDVALLFRASTAFGVYEDALEQVGIPFVTIAGRGFYNRPEVRDLLNALAAIADPTDDLALAGLLRSPAIGLSDAALYQLRWAEDNTRRSFWPALHNGQALAALAKDEQQRAAFACRMIGALHAQVGRVSVAQVLKRFLDETHYRAILRLVPGGERLRRNVDKLLADAHRSEVVNISEFLEYLEALSDVGARESEAPTEAGGAVQLMTIHKAKGLEFPVVVLADAGYTGGFHAIPFYLDQELGLALNLANAETQPAIFRLASYREAEQKAAEERRLLYVAVTRAQEKIIVSGNVKLSTAKQTAVQLQGSGWLADLAGVVGLNEIQLAEPPAAAQTISLAWQNGAVGCTVYPPPKNIGLVLSEDRSPVPVSRPLSLDLLAPLTLPPSAELDEKLQEWESDPPPRVWRVVPDSEYDVPAWVVGSLTHIALRYWHFPDAEDFPDFLRPFALDAGLTDPVSIETALKRTARLLARFQAHPLYQQLAVAERHHEVPYNLMLEGQLHSGIIDLLFRTAPDTPWTIVEFKTDRLPPKVNLQTYIAEKGYDRQVQAYRQAVAQQLGSEPQVLLVFLNVEQSVQTLLLP
ncbi:MAG: UvrD-helicase domain-containing protein [Anaerolineae bacterium]|nr:UvrD-helicase domain-containing protein [Anaerolineae bacterium]